MVKVNKNSTKKAQASSAKSSMTKLGGSLKKKKVQEDWDSDSSQEGEVMVNFLGVMRPVNSLEPWCFCHARKEETMVACDNPKCLMKWFHLSCVGELEAPPEPWHCPMCASDMKKAKEIEERENSFK